VVIGGGEDMYFFSFGVVIERGGKHSYPFLFEVIGGGGGACISSINNFDVSEKDAYLYRWHLAQDCCVTK